MNISIVVPVFNSALCLEELAQRTSAVMHQMGKAFELILVDDGSKDASWETIKTLKARHPFIVGIKLARNYGQQNATLCGIEHAQGDWVVTMDDDLEYPPEAISNLFAKQQEGDYDVVYGAYRKKKRSWLRGCLTWYHKFTTHLFNKKGNFKESSFRLLKSAIAKSILPHQQLFSIIDEFLTWHTDKIEHVLVDCEKSKRMKSGYSLLDLFIISKSLILINSKTQLKFILGIGFWMMVVNFILGIIIIYRKLILSIHVQGYASLIVAILFSSGVIVFSVGVIAENLSRLIKMNYQQPAYEEREVV